jgi:hypothetical protein
MNIIRSIVSSTIRKGTIPTENNIIVMSSGKVEI